MANIPSPPSTNISGMAFPEDLANVGYHMHFDFMKYERSSPISAAQSMPMGGAVALPMPDFINDNPTADWKGSSITQDNKALVGDTA